MNRPPTAHRGGSAPSNVPRVLIVVNDRNSGPRRASTWLAEAGVDPVVRSGPDTPLPESLSGFAGLVLLGGGMMPDADDQAPWLPAERRLAGQAVAADLPTLGICLGGQLLALVAGGRVQAQYGTPERGMTRVTTTAAGSQDQILGELAPSAPVVEHHRDTITELGPSCVLLASSRACPIQAFRTGDHVRGVQFHPEVSSDDVCGWGREHLAACGADPDHLVTQARRWAAESTRRCRGLVDGFAREVHVAAGMTSRNAG